MNNGGNCGSPAIPPIVHAGMRRERVHTAGGKDGKGRPFGAHGGGEKEQWSLGAGGGDLHVIGAWCSPWFLYAREFWAVLSTIPPPRNMDLS